jgi:hypothetical protein
MLHYIQPAVVLGVWVAELHPANAALYWDIAVFRAVVPAVVRLGLWVSAPCVMSWIAADTCELKRAFAAWIQFVCAGGGFGAGTGTGCGSGGGGGGLPIPPSRPPIVPPSAVTVGTGTNPATNARDNTAPTIIVIFEFLVITIYYIIIFYIWFCQ